MRSTSLLAMENTPRSILFHLGIPSGDRSILNYGLPKDISPWCSAAKRALIRNMLAQDGSVSQNGEISWTRSHVFAAGSKATKYDFTSKISSDAIVQVCSEFGRFQKQFVGFQLKDTELMTHLIDE